MVFVVVCLRTWNYCGTQRKTINSNLCLSLHKEKPEFRDTITELTLLKQTEERMQVERRVLALRLKSLLTISLTGKRKQSTVKYKPWKRGTHSFATIYL